MIKDRRKSLRAQKTKQVRKHAFLNPLLFLGPLLLLTAAPKIFAQSLPELSHELSPWLMFQQADWVVKSVMLGLLFASLCSWTVYLVKSVELRRAYRGIQEPMMFLSQAPSLAEALIPKQRYDATVTVFLAAARDELEQSGTLPVAGIKERIDVRFARIHAALLRQAKTGTGLLASVGSVAPFVGLFGTVWGIMNAFIGIAKTQTTNLAVVAPGIAEALLATALGLVAAIPAVVMYNIFARKIADYRSQAVDLANEISRLVSLHLDQQRSPEREESLQLDKSVQPNKTKAQTKTAQINNTPQPAGAY